MEKTYIAIDLKSFYASVECIQRRLDPMTAHLVVADPGRTEKTICLAVSPALKSHGIPGRPRLFEVVEKVSLCNFRRQQAAPGGKFTGASCDETELQTHPEYALDYIVAPPQMALYMEASAAVYGVYLRHVAPEDIHVYSIDEVFLDVTHYLRTAGKTPEEFARMLLAEVLAETGLTATAGIGSNLYLAKIAMDIVAKRAQPDRYGARIAALDERSYREILWEHTPITDFWRVGRGIAGRLKRYGMETMGDVARCSLTNESLLYRLLGIQAELLIDHAWGIEPVEMKHIKAYRPSTMSFSSGQVLHTPYEADLARLVAREMTDQLSMDLVEKGLAAGQLVLTVGYDIENLKDPVRRQYVTQTVTDPYGREIPKHSHGTVGFERPTSSTRELMAAAGALYDRIVRPGLLVRRLTVVVGKVVPEERGDEQLSLFEDRLENTRKRERERKMQETVLALRKKYGKNAVLRCMNLEEGATARQRNGQIGGHRA